jgi:hypothetical protein
LQRKCERIDPGGFTMIRSILVVALVAALAMSASAYDVLYTGDTAMTHDTGAFGITGSFLYLMADSSFDFEGESVDWGDNDSHTSMWFPIDIYYSVMDNFEIGITPMFRMDKSEYEVMARETMEDEGTGIGDTWIWAKYMFLPDPMMTARLGFKVATGEDEPDDDELATGDGQMDIDGAVMFGVPAGPGTFDAAVGYRFRMAREFEVLDETYDYTPGSEIHFAAGYSYFLNDAMALRLGADGYFGGDDEVEEGSRVTVEDSARNAVYINPGFDYVMENGVSLGVDMHYPLMGQNIDALWGFGLTVGWGM